MPCVSNRQRSSRGPLQQGFFRRGSATAHRADSRGCGGSLQCVRSLQHSLRHSVLHSWHQKKNRADHGCSRTGQQGHVALFLIRLIGRFTDCWLHVHLERDSHRIFSTFPDVAHLRMNGPGAYVGPRTFNGRSGANGFFH